MDEFRFSLPVKASFLARRKPLTPTEVNLMRVVLDRIAREGPQKAIDFENYRVTKSSGWWDWRPAKLALERLHLEGKLATWRRRDFQKSYDLAENLHLRGIDTSMPSSNEYARYVIRRALKRMGVVNVKEISFVTRYVKNSVKEELQNMVNEGKVCVVEVDGIEATLFYMLPEYRKRKITISGDAFVPSPLTPSTYFGTD